MHNIKLQRSGLALIVVLLVILGATAAGIYAVQISQADQKNITGIQYRQQASYATHQAASFLTSEELINNVDIIKMASDANAVRNQRGAVCSNVIKSFSGLGPDLPGTGETYRLRGDLARRTKQIAAVSDPVLSPEQTPGDSEQKYCQYIFTGESYSLFGRSVEVRGTNADKYYLLADLNAHQTGFRREIGLLIAEHLSCY